MKKLFMLLCLASFLTISFSNDVNAQSRKKKKKTSRTDEYFDESGNFLSKVWFAGGVNLNWGNTALGTTQGFYPGTIFQFGLSPMAGYEFIEGFSVGPRLEFLYQSGRFDLGQNDAKYNSFDLGLGAFSRYRFNNGLFIHGEYQLLNEEVPRNINFNDAVVETSKQQENNLFIGAGFSQGGIWGYEIYVLYNTQEEFTSDNLPLYYRFGINYKFN